MKLSLQRKHSSGSLFLVILFGLFILFLLLLLLFSTEAYQTAVNGSKENHDLRTAMTYITTKVHQHNAEDSVFSGKVNDLPALCIRDTINEKDYITYIYLDDHTMKELFTSASNIPTKELGTPFCEMSFFELQEEPNGIYRLFLKDQSGHEGELFLHPGIPAGGQS